MPDKRNVRRGLKARKSLANSRYSKCPKGKNKKWRKRKRRRRSWLREKDLMRLEKLTGAPLCRMFQPSHMEKNLHITLSASGNH